MDVKSKFKRSHLNDHGSDINDSIPKNLENKSLKFGYPNCLKKLVQNIKELVPKNLGKKNR